MDHILGIYSGFVDASKSPNHSDFLDLADLRHHGEYGVQKKAYFRKLFYEAQIHALGFCNFVLYLRADNFLFHEFKCG